MPSSSKLTVFHFFAISQLRNATSFSRNCDFVLVKSREKNRNVNFYPSAKRRRDLKIVSSGVIFHGRHSYSIQKFPTPPKQAVFKFPVVLRQGCHKVFTRFSQGFHKVFTRFSLSNKVFTRFSQGFHKVFTFR